MREQLHILIAGGSGLIGSYLKKRFEESGALVRTISRSGKDAGWGADELRRELESCNVLINLAGKSINSRFTKKNKKEILRSRIEATSLLNEALLLCEKRPHLWINASASAIYRESGIEQAHNEKSKEFAGSFLGGVVQKWEQEFFSKEIESVRKVALRITPVLSKKGGVYARFRFLATTGLGGKQGSGEQMFSWIHIEDFFKIVRFIIDHEDISGIINAASPGAVSNRDFMQALRKSLGVPFGLPAPERMIKPALKVIGIDASLVLDSSHLKSSVLEDKGFRFQFPDIASALSDLSKK